MNVIQITKKHYNKSKVVSEHEKLVVTRLTFRSAENIKWTNIFAFGSDFGITMNESALRELYQRIGEVLNGK